VKSDIDTCVGNEILDFGWVMGIYGPWRKRGGTLGLEKWQWRVRRLMGDVSLFDGSWGAFG